DGLMVGRAAYGNPWIFGQIKAYLNDMPYIAFSREHKVDQILWHIARIHEHYGEYLGVRIARKHMAAYLPQQEERKAFNQLTTAGQQLGFLQQQLLIPANYQAA
ncbi:MAG: tRNA-dihydrouridine synthase, partial [Pseudomonadales bacterium]